MKEYVITLKDFNDLDTFYDDMETPGGNLYIPNRAVDCVNRRAISRNTHYMLTDEEAEQIRNDPRVLACELTPKQLGIKVIRDWVQSSNYWDKSSTTSNLQKNWGLLRCVEGAQRSNWGIDGITNQSGTVIASAEGRNVDIVIVDGMINPDHPEFALNDDGSGGSRVVQYNWLQHADTPGTYLYTPYVDSNDFDRTDDNDHGCHVAGTTAGNTQGWARKANIYNINPYATDINGLDTLFLFDYMRAWHNNKPINPITGRRNPTICNNSWGYGYSLNISDISNVNYRGVNYTSNLTSNTLKSYGILNDGTNTQLPARYIALEQDILDAINDGIIVVGSAGNRSMKMDIPNGEDYNNYFIWSGFYVPYHQGGAPQSGDNVICVGAIGTFVDDRKVTFSNCGPRVDIYAPGTQIISSVNSITSVRDQRNSSYYLAKYSGTSMASPQVTGVLACAMEVYPNLNQESARNYLFNTVKNNQITGTNGGYTDLQDLQGSPNRYLYYYKERADTGSTWPKLNYKPRPTSGRMYPRQRIRR
jgi:subtilisin family serine protease